MLLGGRPGDVRGFVHRRIFGGIKGAIGGLLGGGPLGVLGGAAKGFITAGRRPRPPVVRPVFDAPILVGQRPLAAGRPSPLTLTKCPPGFVLSRSGCVPTGAVAPTRRRSVFQGFGEDVLRTITGREAPPMGAAAFAEQEVEFGEAVMGQYGAGIQPGNRVQNTAVCPRGTVLGTDGICYNRRDIRNTERMWPRGRRPLLTGGDMRCISVASAAAGKLRRKQKQLEELGLLKKPTTRRRKALPPGHHAHVAHDGG